MESFFKLLQKKVLNRQRWQNRKQLRRAIVVWIERTYHRRRPQDALGRLTLIEFETDDPDRSRGLTPPTRPGQPDPGQSRASGTASLLTSHSVERSTCGAQPAAGRFGR
jgi:hypothetical protein